MKSTLRRVRGLIQQQNATGRFSVKSSLGQIQPQRIHQQGWRCCLLLLVVFSAWRHFQPLRLLVADSRLDFRKQTDSAAMMCSFQGSSQKRNELFCQNGPRRQSPVLQLSHPEAASPLHVYSNEVQPVCTAGRSREPQREQGLEMVRRLSSIFCVFLNRENMFNR